MQGPFNEQDILTWVSWESSAHVNLSRGVKICIYMKAKYSIKKYVLKFCFSLKLSEVKMASLLIGKDAGQRIAFKSETFKFRPSVYFLFQ